MILGVIPARGNSQRIKNKNTIELCGKILIEYTIDAAENSELQACVVSTDDDAICLAYNGHMRHRSLWGDTLIIDVLQDLLIQDKTEIVSAIMLLQPTSPLRTIEDINQALRIYQNNNCSSLYTGYKLKYKTKDVVYNGTSIFQRNGAIFITSRELLEQGKIWDENVYEMEMPKSRSVDIDTMDDLKFAECLIKGGVLGLDRPQYISKGRAHYINNELVSHELSSSTDRVYLDQSDTEH